MKMSLFEGKWLPYVDGHCLKPRTLSDELKNMKVVDIIVDRQCNFDRVEGVLDEEEWIGSVRIPMVEEADRYIWLGSKDGEYSVKLGYKTARNEERTKTEGEQVVHT